LMFFFGGFCCGMVGQVVAFRFVRKREEKLPKCTGKDPPEARMCDFSGNPRRMKRGCVNTTLTFKKQLENYLKTY